MRYFLAALVFLLVGCEAKVAVKSEPAVTQSDVANLKQQIADQQTQIESFKKTVPVPVKLAAKVPLAAAATPTGVVVSMSDGTTQVYPLGVWIEFASGSGCNPSCPSGTQLRGIFPTQYVNQVATVHTGTATGTGATATATVTAPNALSLTVTAGGTAYVNPVVTISGGTGQPGNVTIVNTGGVITSISAPNAGGYTLTDVLTVTITDTPPQTWTYTRAGRNVQVWRNGLLQRLGATGCTSDAATCGGDYMLNTATMTITPLLLVLGDGTRVPNWDPTDYVTVAYLF